jgi:hypothetical protein
VSARAAPVRARDRRDARPRILAAALLAVLAGVHFQQYVDFMSHVPTVGVLFLLNAAGGAGMALALVGADALLRVLAALGGLGLAVGSLACIVVALTGSFAGFHEPTLRLPIVIAIVAEALAVPVCLIVLGRLEVRALTRSAASPSSPR